MKRVQPFHLIAILLIAGIFSAAPRICAAGTPSEQGPIPQSNIPPYIIGAVNSPKRPAADKALDSGRKPAQMMAFFGIKPGMKVADIWAGGGWTTELLSLIVGPDGKVYSLNRPLPPHSKALQAWRARRKTAKNIVEIEQPFGREPLLPVKRGALDAVIINMNYHDLVHIGVDMRRFNNSIYKFLKPGGVYGIVDNSAKAGTGAQDVGTIHRIDEQYVINQVEQANFVLAASSGVLRNPKDDRTWFIMKHRGQQDRFMLKFVKPASAHNQTQP
ncbi:MAG: class I SAM-dependent methyltransferase [Candidatus Binataceae bacterium]